MSARTWGQPRRGTQLTSFTARLTPGAKDRLMALAQIREVNAYELVEEAFWDLWRGLPADEKEGAEALLNMIDKVRGTRQQE